MLQSFQNSEFSPQSERRASQRFPIVVPVEYKAFWGEVCAGEGIGCTINIASKGILFQADPPLEPGMRLQITLEWPVLHEMNVHLRLHANAQIVRLRDDRVAVRLIRPEFQREELHAG